MTHYYGFSLEQIEALTFPQFMTYLNDIGAIQEMFMGGGKGRTKESNQQQKQMLDTIAGLGLKAPRSVGTKK